MSDAPPVREDTRVRLSVCIPTYNFGAFIAETLQSIATQLQDGVEIVVLDGGSSDDTAEVVGAFAQRHPQIRYHRRPERGGIDRDMARTVALASGEYCWLFGADDTMQPGALARMLTRLDGDAELLLCGVTYCSLQMEPLFQGEVAQISNDTRFDFSLREQRLSYFSRASTTLAFFSFLGSIVFSRQRWDEIGLDERFVGSLFAHVARLFAMIAQGATFDYLPDSYVLTRGGNDSFLDRGIVNRYAKVIDGYHELAAAAFGADSDEAAHVRRAVRAEFPLWLALDMRYAVARERPEDLAELRRITHRAYSEPGSRYRLYRTLYDRTPQRGMVAARQSMRALRAARASLSGS
ncbi:MAG TPA: glycosyltransferase family 2 protein [Solirubrobacteraceae bacterium]|nr:glycosyltransferase family 2 protein [Solirubrobacteraceae bacterium]